MSADRVTRDFQLAELADYVANEVGGLAYTAHVVCKGGVTKTEYFARGRRIDVMKEIVGRFVDHTMTLQTAMIDYSPTMTEAELRSWAAWIYGEVTGR